MFGFFKSSGPGSGQANFELGPEATLPFKEKHIFRLHEGTLKNGGAPNGSTAGGPCSVFVCEDPSLLSSASAAVKRLKTLRHPSVLTFVDSSESESRVMVATERVTPLSVHLDELDARGVRGAPRDQYLAWGIFQVLRGLAFLNNDAKLRHNGLHGDAIFVTRAGDWKLFALDRVTSTDPDSFPAAPLQSLQKYEPPESADFNKRRQSTAWSRDMWGAGCVIWEVFNGPLPAAKNLGKLGDIPARLTGLYKELVAANPAKRPNPKERLETMRRPGPNSYFRTPLVDALLFLEEIHLKDEADKARFYSDLSRSGSGNDGDDSPSCLLDSVPSHVGCYKILPELIKAFEFGSAGASILGPVFRLGKELDSEEYVRMVVPCVVKMFASNDRNARFKLLSQVDMFAEHLTDKVVNEEVYPQIQNGFLDQEPVIREKTVISVIHLAPKLTFANLDESVVLRHFSRLLRDEQPGIRTNTTVCLGKIARFLHHTTRQKVLVGAFAGKLRDPFPPARIAAINAMAACQAYFTLAETSGRVLPALCPALTDVEEPVRMQAFKVVRGFVEKLDQVHKDPSLKEEMEAEVNSTMARSATSSTAAGWASWAVGAIGAKFYKSAPKPPAPTTPAAPDSSAAPTTTGSAAGPSSRREQEDEKRSSEISEMSFSSSETSAGAAAAAAASGDGWDDDDGDWGSLEDAKPATAAVDNSNDQRLAERTQNSLKLRDSFAGPATKNKEEDSWDAWGDDGGEDPLASLQKSKEEERRLREEKRAARRAEMAARKEARKGPMKLGAKKD